VISAGGFWCWCRIWAAGGILCGAMWNGDLSAKADEPRSVAPTSRISGFTLGTRFSVRVTRIPSGLDLEQVRLGVERELAGVVGRLSLRREDSALSRFNRESGADWVPVSAELVHIIAEAQQLSRVSDSALDVTSGPVVDAWNLDAEAPQQTTPPAPTVLARARERMGMHKLQFRVENPALRKTDADLELDLSILARGHGVDRVAGFLESQGIAD